MSHVLTLVAATENLSIAHLEKLETFVESNGIGITGKPVWLDPHIAADLPVENAVTMEQMKALRAFFNDDKVDILCMKTETRKKRLLLADMDSTIVTTETLDELAGKAGIKDKIAAITARAMNGELDFRAALRERVGLLKGLPLSALQETLDETVLCDGAECLVRTMREDGAVCVLVSGGFTFFTGAIAGKAGFHHHHGNSLDDDGAVLLGTVGGDILDKDSKLSYLKSYTQELGLDLNQSLAVGDGANDLPMLAAAGLGIGYRPKPVLAETLLNILQFADLRGVLYAQGYKNIC